MTRILPVHRLRLLRQPLLYMFVCLGLTGCLETVGSTLISPFTNEQAPAPAKLYGISSGGGSAGIHTVSSGETLWTIAERYKLSLQDIIHMNGLQPPYTLAANARIKLPPPQNYTARADDTVYSISQTFNVSPMEIARLNNLSAPYALSAGQVVRLPSVAVKNAPSQTASSISTQGGYSTYASEPIMPARAPAAVEAQVLDAPVLAGRGDNGVYSDAGAHIDSDIMPPEPRAINAPVPVNMAESSIANAPNSGGMQPTLASATMPVPAPAKMLAKIPSETPPRAGKYFAWPVKGKIYSSYGRKKDGLHNDGINILASEGTPVRSAENGVVVYAGSELKGFGNLILIRHADRWMSAYGHLGEISVARGQIVKMGDVVGRVGKTGAVDRPQLHFEIRRGTEALNPQVYLAKDAS